MSSGKNKTTEVLNHLLNEGTITSMQAFELYGATRLSAIIFELRKKYDIDTLDMECVDRYGHTCHFAKYRMRGIVSFSDNNWYEYMFLYSANEYTGEMTECSEGDLVWVPMEDVLTRLPVWEGDKIFLKLMQSGEPFFSLKLRYENKVLKKAILNGNELQF